MRIACLALLLLGLGCGTLSFETEPLEERPITLSISSAPPPPVDIENPDPPTECPDFPNCPPGPTHVSVAGRYFRNPAGSMAWLTFAASVPAIEISPDAQVRDQGAGGIGRGTIIMSIFAVGDPTARRIRIDLTTVQGSLLASPRPGFREATFTAQAKYLASGLPVERGVFFYFAY